MQPKPFFHTRITKPKSRYARRHNVESLLRAVCMAWQSMWICQSVNNALDFDERRRPCMAEKQGNGIGVFRPLVYEVYAQGLCGVERGEGGYGDGGAVLRESGVEARFGGAPVVAF
jgi:hypothetical protein